MIPFFQAHCFQAGRGYTALIMKLVYKQIDPFVKKPDPAARVVLVYGPDAGLVKERSKIIALSVVSDINDPFNAVTLTGDALLEDPARLADEAAAMSMLGGGRLIRIEDADDKITPILKDYLQNPSTHNLVLLEAGELGARSVLRALCEKSANAAAVPCYVEDERNLSSLIRDMLRERNIAVESDALLWLAAALTGDRARARAEIEKLITYKGADRTPLSLADAQNCCGDAGAQNFDHLVYAIAGGQGEAALRAYDALTAEGVPFTAMLRSVANHYRRLHITRARMDAGENAESAMKSLAPPVFFKQETAFRGQASRYSLTTLSAILQRLYTLEAQCKKTGIPAEILCAQAFLSLSKSAA